jgi:hypothetical protein
LLSSLFSPFESLFVNTDLRHSGIKLGIENKADDCFQISAKQSLAAKKLYDRIDAARALTAQTTYQPKSKIFTDSETA